MSNTKTKTVVVVTVVWIVPVAVSGAHVLTVIVERAAAQNTVAFGQTLHNGSDDPDVTEDLVHPPSKRPISATISAAW
ncbi:MAG: hypothetical protein Fur0035_21480 [Anaerolineales bacterium]